MKYNHGGRFVTAALGLSMAGAMALSGCSSSKKTTTADGSSASTGSASAPASSGSGDCATGSLKAEGSTAQQNAMTKWINDYQKKCSGSTITYNGTGSGAGVLQFIGKQVDFAGSDSALNPTADEPAKAKAACGSTALDLPMVVGPVAIAFKVKGVEDGALTLTPKLIAQIFLGKIKKWNDPAIAAANAGVNLPGEDITVFFRQDQSGTTNNFENYLAATDPTDFTAAPSKIWPGTVGQGKTGSQGVQQAVTATEGGIAYLEYSFALNGNLSTAKVDNGGGAVELTPDTASAAAAAAKVVGTGSDVSLKIDYATKAAGAYPIILTTYEIVCSKYSDPKIGAFVKSFLTYTAGDGQTGLGDLGYAPIPEAIKTKVVAAIASLS